MQSHIVICCVAACVAIFFPHRSALAEPSHQRAGVGAGFGDPAIIRKALTGRGLTYGLNYTGDLVGNVTSGARQSAHYDGLLELWADIDFQKLAGWRGLTFHVNAFQIHGTSITAENIGSLVSVSNIEAFPSTRLDELWFEQELLDELISVRFGELAIDSEFLIAESTGVFIASTFGWTTLTSDNLPYGGPIYPFAAPGVRVALEPGNDVKLMAGIYNSDPIGPCPEDLDPGECNQHGLEFRLKDPALLLVEGDYGYGRGESSFPGRIKLGGWYHFETFDQQNPKPASQRGRRHEGNYGLYAVLDQVVYRRSEGAEAGGVSVFIRAVVSPSDRNQIHAYADAGLVLTGIVPRRPHDVIGIGVAYTGLSDEAAVFHAPPGACFNQNCEALLELTYAAEITPRWTLQPVVQYIHNPGGGLSEEAAEDGISDALVLGVRTMVNF